MGILEVAAAWRDQDPDPETRAELDRLIANHDEAELHDRFDTRLEFGTAGLRGRIEAGSNRMNRVLVGQAAAGLAAYLLAKGEQPSVAIGYDGRKNSRVFAADTAELMAGAGVRAILLPRLLPTPVLAFAVRHLDVSAGVMVTASHNPPQDNGYKVYLGGADAGSQIVPPADGEIAAEIARVAATLSVLDLPRSDNYEIAVEEVLDEYVRRTAALSPGPHTQHGPHARLNYVYTAMHGVGWETAHRVFLAAGFGEPVIVAEQIEPDAAFPTVTFPNPEEPGAMDLAFETATAVGADLVIANDPDADRLAVGIPTPTGWERLSGNEVGALLGWRAAERGATVVASSIVSSPALAAVAEHYGITCVETLTGFKWVSRVPGLSYGYEEALGYLVDPDTVRDKDGISAAVEFIALAAELKEAGTTFAEHRAAFAAAFGSFSSGQLSLRVTDLTDIPRMMARLRGNLPGTIAGHPVLRVDDFAAGLGDLPPSDILRFRLEGGARVIVRPSGTEPKVKVYLDAESGERVAELETAIRTLLAP